ncbi:porin family protein [Bradyrhizobium sp. IC3069]|uniref:Outer membrane immunogenic protein n=1 Tax=Bradyrhizobium yuanmingense TaxID=108015 RepID=A0A1C3UP06_9BRAD|nr:MULTISPECIES: outer membrane protein [Bradyrhizobium]MCA1385700.1 porin family protein [Bradyrhizobium sp. BRP05]MCA1364772.1 porin family protein [Bradyrhizobium sp. IC4059]MCA1377773.1 porin family protein [Bradyrhizobium sp. IC4060]MCA1422464.1 porin family protein [Bradyrhizobium sp. BRP23]MCA1431053.1 porin family protein [Bradyrhizobium sp. NBAIM16]
MKLAWRTILVAGIGFATVGSASAADLAARPFKAPATAVAVYNWTGFYVGVNAGYAWGQSDLGTVLDPTSSWAVEGVAFRNEFVALSNRRLDPAGAIGGLQIGANWQTGAWVLGVEADANATDIGARTVFTGANPPVIRTFDESIRNDWLVTVRGRAGYAVDKTLLYVTGGLAVGSVKGSWDLTSSNGYTKTGSVSETKVGWTVGAGVEHAFVPNWTVKLEYLYTDLGGVDYTSTYVPGSTFAPPGSNYVERISQDLTFHTVRAGLNYKFGGPMMAKY